MKDFSLAIKGVCKDFCGNTRLLQRAGEYASLLSCCPWSISALSRIPEKQVSISPNQHGVWDCRCSSPVGNTLYSKVRTSLSGRG